MKRCSFWGEMFDVQDHIAPYRSMSFAHLLIYLLIRRKSHCVHSRTIRFIFMLPCGSKKIIMRHDFNAVAFLKINVNTAHVPKPGNQA